MRQLRLLVAIYLIPLACLWAEGTSYLGVGLVDVEGANGVEVRSVVVGSPAAKAGIRTGDVLVTYNGETILGDQQLARLVAETPPGRRVNIQFVREGRAAQTTAVTLAARPAPNPPLVRIPLSSDGSFPMAADIPAPLLTWHNMIIGVECESLNSQLASYFGVQRGILLRFVEHGSIADVAGLRAGDVIVAAGERALGTSRELTQAFRTDAGPGKPLHLSVIRQHRRLAIDVSAPEE